MRGLEKYTAGMGSGWTQEPVRLVMVDGHQVAWVVYRYSGPDRELSGAHLLCDCDLDEMRNDRTSVVGVQDLDPLICRYRAAARLLRCLEVREQIRDPNDLIGDKLAEQLVDVVERGHGGEWVGQASSEAMWLGEIQAIFDASASLLRETAYGLMRAKRLGLSGMMV